MQISEQVKGQWDHSEEDCLSCPFVTDKVWIEAGGSRLRSIPRMALTGGP